MSFFVPYDDSPLSRSALRRSRDYAEAVEESLYVYSVVPDSAEYARKKNWIEPDEEFVVEDIVTYLRSQVADIAPMAHFEFLIADPYIQPGTVASRIRRQAQNREATTVAIGSDNAGRVMSPITSVGGKVAAERTFDLLVIRRVGDST